MRMNLLTIAFLGLAVFGCSDDDGPTPTATRTAIAQLASTAGNTATASATFTNNGTRTTLTATVSGAPANAMLGFHIHMNAACGADGMEAGGHWNPESVNHGQWTTTPHHLGDIGNVSTDASGATTLSLTTDAWAIGTGATNDVVNHAMVLHAMADDLTSQPAGNAGARIACGVIQLK